MDPKEVAGSISKADSMFLFCIKINSLCILWIVNPIMIDVQNLVKIWNVHPEEHQKFEKGNHSDVWWFAEIIAATVYQVYQAQAF